jgi:divalent metal cation (Fe/Co/Zn/Cd) transporter
VVAGNICRTGLRIVRRSVHGLMDIALPPEELAIVHEVLQQYQPQGIQYHALRTRQAGALRFVAFHVIVPGSWTVHQGHQLLEQMEAGIRGALENVVVFTHLESLDDPPSWSDVDLDRRDPPH